MYIYPNKVQNAVISSLALNQTRRVMKKSKVTKRRVKKSKSKLKNKRQRGGRLPDARYLSKVLEDTFPRALAAYKLAQAEWKTPI